MADQWRPASPNEAYHIVRQRLFATPDADALGVDQRRRAASSRCTTATPTTSRARRATAATRTGSSRPIPIHPELFDRLYEDWSSLERFQRTRGVLRLMNTVIHALWVGETSRR